MSSESHMQKMVLEHTELANLQKRSIAKRMLGDKCVTMAHVLTNTGLGGENFADILLKYGMNPVFHAILKNDTSQDPTADLVELSELVYSTPGPIAIGRELVNIVMMGKPTKRVRIKDRAKTGLTSRMAKSRSSKRVVHRFIDLLPKREFEAHATWDEQSLEDLEYDAVGDDVQGISEAMQEDESQHILTKIFSTEVGKISGGAAINAETAGEMQFNDIINMFTRLQEHNYVGDKLAIHPLQFADLMKQQVFQDSLMLGEYVNYNRGSFGKTLLGFQIYVSPQVPATKAVGMQTKYPYIYAIRRNKLMESYQEVTNGSIEYGIKVSTRAEMYEAVPAGMTLLENA